MTQPNDPRLPWRPEGNGSAHILNADGDHVATVFIENGTDADFADRIALIVRSVNSHAALVDACRSALDAMDIATAHAPGVTLQARLKIHDAINLAEDQHEPG